MPPTRIVFYLEEDGHVPVLEWLQQLRRENKRAYGKCLARIERLAEEGHELRCPEAENLGQGIYELRISYGHVNYRILYFFHERVVAVLAHAPRRRTKFQKRTFSGPYGERPRLNNNRHGIPTRETPMAKTSDALKILDRITGDDSELRALIAQEKLHVQIARMIYEARTEAGLTQQQLADLIGTTQSAISRLEDADYEGHSLAMLERVAKALHKRLELRLVEREPVAVSASFDTV